MKQQLKYKILESIGQKKSGRVFSAFEPKSGELVALKKLSQIKLSTKDFLSKLSFVCSLDHPNIVACRNLEYKDNSRYLVMNYGEGGSLRNAIARDNFFSLDQSLQLIIDILSGLEYAHNRGIVHRNLKPENILLKLNNNGWKAQIADFELMRFNAAIDNKERVFSETHTVYKAPEQFLGQSSYSSDIYGVGVLLFELLTGKPPFVGESQELMLANRECRLVIPDRIPLILHSAIAKALQPQPDRRFSNAGKMLESIQLAKEILSKTQPDTDLQLSAYSEGSDIPLTIISQEKLLQPVTYLAVNSQQVYLETKNRLCGKLYADSSLTGKAIKQWQIFLDGNLDSLEIRPQGCFAVTKSACIYYSPQKITTKQFNFFSTTSLPIISLPTKKLVTTIDPQGYWLGLAYIPSKVQGVTWEILQLPSLKVVRSQQLQSLPDRLIALNRRYGLAMFSTKQQQQFTTTLRLFNRRGNWLGNYSLSVALRLVTYNPQFGDRLLAIEDSKNNPTMGLLIDLKPLQVRRIPLPFNPAFIIPQTQGYLLCDRQGRIAIVNGENNRVSLFQIPITQGERITAIAATNPSQLLVATWSRLGGSLLQLSLDNVISS